MSVKAYCWLLNGAKIGKHDKTWFLRLGGCGGVFDTTALEIRNTWSPVARNRVDAQRSAVAFKPSRTGPLPISRAFNVSFPDWIEMEVLNHGFQGVSLGDVSIESAARLPKEPLGPLSATPGKPLNPWRIFRLQEPKGSFRYGLLHFLQNARNTLFAVRRINDQVHMIGHKHVGP